MMRACVLRLQSPQFRSQVTTTMSTAHPHYNPNQGMIAASAVFNNLSDHIRRSYRLDQIISECSASDVIIARQETTIVNPGPQLGRLGSAIVAPGAGTSAYSYLGFRDVSPSDVAKCLLLIPEGRRQFHTVCGRDKHHCDFFADIDLPTASSAEGEGILLQVLDRIDGSLRALDFGKYELMVLESNHTAGLSTASTKRSYHLHVRGVESCFEDFRAPRALAENINMSIGSAVIDTGCYRQSGSLRTAFSAKAGPTASYNRFMPMQAHDAELKRRLLEMSDMSPDHILERSLVTRDIRAVKGTLPPTPSVTVSTPAAPKKGKKGAKKASASAQEQQGDIVATTHVPGPLRIFNGRGGVVGEMNKRGTKGLRKVCVDAAGQAVPRFFREEVKWLRYKMAIEKLHALPSAAAADYGVWVRVGLALHNFGTESFLYREWLRFSMKCPEKFDRDACEKKWKQFGQESRTSALNPDFEKENWRRGYNYLTSTVWRDIATHRPL